VGQLRADRRIEQGLDAAASMAGHHQQVGGVLDQEVGQRIQDVVRLDPDLFDRHPGLGQHVVLLGVEREEAPADQGVAHRRKAGPLRGLPRFGDVDHLELAPVQQRQPQGVFKRRHAFRRQVRRVHYRGEHEGGVLVPIAKASSRSVRR
jgi:hypothetical protein